MAPLKPGSGLGPGAAPESAVARLGTVSSFAVCFSLVELWKVQTTKVSATNRVKLSRESQNAKSDQIRAMH